MAKKPLLDFKARIRQLTRRSGGRSMEQVVQRLRPYQAGLEGVLRAGANEHWKRPATVYRELKALGAGETVAKRVAGNSRRWWRNSDRLLKTVLTIRHFDRLGVPRLS